MFAAVYAVTCNHAFAERAIQRVCHGEQRWGCAGAAM